MPSAPSVPLVHPTLNASFAPTTHHKHHRIQQFLGIKYAVIPARFRQSRLFSSYPPFVDASAHGPICPQLRSIRSNEETLFGIPPEDIPKQHLKHDEFECLNLNITRPAGLTPQSRIPVMLWIHGGGDRGSGSCWIYDAGNIVQKAMDCRKPVILVTFNFRIGLLGFAASPVIRDDNKAAGEEGAGNYGLRDQRTAMEWIHRYIAGFGGDPDNVTLFGASSGAADIICHLLSAANESKPLFHRAIVQSAVFEPTLPDVSSAGWHLSRIMSALQISTIDQLRAIEPERLSGLGTTIRAIDDGVWFRKGWRAFFGKDDTHTARHHHLIPHTPSLLAPPALVGKKRSKSRSKSALRSLRSPSRPRSVATLQHTVHTAGTLQPLIIGDCTSDALLWSLPISLWTSTGVVRRLKAVCQSLSKASSILRAYDISSYTSDDEIVERVLELVNDARVAYPTECLAENVKKDCAPGRGVWRYVFDQEGPSRGVPHHAADLVYLFDNVPLPASTLCPPPEEVFCDGPFDVDSDSDDDQHPMKVDPSTSEDEAWLTTVVDEWAYTRVRDAIQERWIAFAYGEAPWAEDKFFVFGPEGETGERSTSIFEGRRRKKMWKEALEPLGAALVQKVGVELSRGPSMSGSYRH